MFYFDTSFLVTAFTPEAATEKAQDWLAAQTAGSLYISKWVLTEFSSALSMKLRTSDITIERRATVMNDWRIFCETNVTVLTVESEHFDAASQMVENHSLGLRAGDALHIAIARTAGCRMVTLDKRMQNAAPEVGVGIVVA